jgi:hypothetical protein
MREAAIMLLENAIRHYKGIVAALEECLRAVKAAPQGN